MGSTLSSKVEAVNEVLRGRHQTMLLLQEQLNKAQERMKETLC